MANFMPMCILPQLQRSGTIECLREDKDHASRSVGLRTDNFVWEGVKQEKLKWNKHCYESPLKQSQEAIREEGFSTSCASVLRGAMKLLTCC